MNKLLKKLEKASFTGINEYSVGTLMRPGVEPFANPDEGVELTGFADGAIAVFGTPDDLVARLRELQQVTSGFGTVVGFVHDWANREATLRSWDLVARYVVPEMNGMLDAYRESRQYVNEHRDTFDRAREAIMAKIHANPLAVEALKAGAQTAAPLGSHHATDFSKAAADTKDK